MSYYSTYYQKHKGQIIDSAKNFAALNPDKVRGYKHKHKLLQRKALRDFVDSCKTKCKLCQETRKQCLEFHHLGNKSITINRMVQEGYSLSALKIEIAKCDILCANCHRKQHATTGKPYGNPKGKYVQAIKESSKCSKCGESFWACLDFHHICVKILNIGAMIRNKTYTLDDIKKEIAKCEILCVNCHRVEHS